MEFQPRTIAYAEIHTQAEQEFYSSLVLEGMEEGSYAIAAAMRAFRRWRDAGQLTEQMRG